MRTVIYGNSVDFLKQFKITDPGKTVAAWLKYLPGSEYEGKQVKEITYFQIIKDGILWQVFALVELE
jgi:hypothetical protein